MSKITVKRINNEEKQNLNIDSWAIWECPTSEFDWEYANEEMCLIHEGEVIVSTAIEEVKISKGDFVIFPKGLKCYWKVLKPINKSYKFN